MVAADAGLAVRFRRIRGIRFAETGRAQTEFGKDGCPLFYGKGVRTSIVRWERPDVRARFRTVRPGWDVPESRANRQVVLPPVGGSAEFLSGTVSDAGRVRFPSRGIFPIGLFSAMGECVRICGGCCWLSVSNFANLHSTNTKNRV